jgi:SNF2 family DNA or RNA helicase
MDFIQSMSKVNIILTSFGVLKQDIDFLRTCRFQYVILDESQYIKNPSSQNFISVKQLQAAYRLALTGTPLENTLSDLWAQMDFLNEGILGKLGEFRSRFREANMMLDDGEQKKLLRIIQPFILRRTKEEVAPELPLLTSEIIYCKMKDDQEAVYLKEKNKIRNALLEHASDRKGTFSAAALSGLTRLRLLANHPVISIPDYEGSSAKFEQIIENVEILIAERHKVLIFSSFVKHLKLLASYFDDRNWQYAWLTGSTVDRQEAINKFSSDEQVYTFFISLKAGGTGLNLTAADYVFIIDPWWNPSAEMQAVSRAHRIGQKKNVTLYRFITEGTIEEKIQQLQHHKTTLAEGLIRPQFSEDEIKELLA